jgi:endonuclease/exonuclease/phosphatase (EEP) superfamily protein YafD
MREWRSYAGQSLGFLSRRPVAFAEWTRPRVSRHAFIEVVPEGRAVRVFGVHLSAVHAAWTERRRVFELRALLRSVARHQDGFHVLSGDFNTVAPGEQLDVRKLPLRLRPLVWISGGRIRWRTVQTVLDAGYMDSFRTKHADDPGLTLPTPTPHIRIDYVFVPAPFAARVATCDVVRHPQAAAASDHFPVVADLMIQDEERSARAGEPGQDVDHPAQARGVGHDAVDGRRDPLAGHEDATDPGGSEPVLMDAMGRGPGFEPA